MNQRWDDYPNDEQRGFRHPARVGHRYDWIRSGPMYQPNEEERTRHYPDEALRFRSGMDSQPDWMDRGAERPLIGYDRMQRGERFQAQSRGQHFGKGPKNFQPSDDEIRKELCITLAQDGAVDASEIEVEVKDGVALISGTVDSRWTKYVIEEIAAGTPYVKDVDLHLRIAPHWDVRAP